MASVAILILVFGATLAASRVGAKIARLLPQTHLTPEARHSAHVGIGMLATLLALVLGLLITSAKHSFDDRQGELLRISSTVVLLDRALVGYGEGAAPARMLLRQLFAGVHRRIKPEEGVQAKASSPMDSLNALTQLQHTVLHLPVNNEVERWYQARAMQLTAEIAQDRVLMVEQHHSTVPVVLVVVVSVWVILIYLGLGVFGVRNRTVNTVLDVCALAFACAIFLVIELDTPYAGMVGVSTEPLGRAAQALAG